MQQAADGPVAIPPPELGVPPRPTRAVQAGRRALGVVRVAFGVVLTAALVVALVGGGLFVAPEVGTAVAVGPPRRPPIIPPSVPEGAREDWAFWSYVQKVNEAWGKDWPLVIELFKEYDGRYPGNSVIKDKLYASYIEDGRTLQFTGDLAGAHRRFEQAAAYDPDRPEAEDFLAELAEREAAGRR